MANDVDQVTKIDIETKVVTEGGEPRVVRKLPNGTAQEVVNTEQSAEEE